MIYVLSFSILLPVLIAIVRFKIIGMSYYPFIGAQILGLINELVYDPVAIKFGTSAPSENIHVLLETMMFVWQFKKWNLFTNKKTYILLQSFITITWFCEIFYHKTLLIFFSFFIILSSFLIILLSINMVNRLLISLNGILFKNPIFLISAGFIIFFTYRIIVEVFWVSNISGVFADNVYLILSIINFLVNIVYALAVLWIPRKQTFILPSS